MSQPDEGLSKDRESGRQAHRHVIELCYSQKVVFIVEDEMI